MNPEESAQLALAEIIEIVQQQTLPPAARIAQVTNAALRYRVAVLGSAVSKQTNFIVPYGPFAGMRCINGSAGSTIVPRLLGSYEAELHDTIKNFSRRGYQRVVNIGCGEGYYAVGLARLLPAAHVFALDPEPAARSLCNALAELNEVADRITLMGNCTPHSLQELAHPGSLIVCDCEGAELELLDLVTVPNLSQCDILVEMHDFLSPDTSITLANRFRSTHTTRVIPQSSRNLQDYPILSSLNEFDRLLSMYESRPGPTPWGIFLANSQ